MTKFLAGAAAALAGRALFVRALRLKFERDLAKLNAGDYQPLLGGYAEDAVLVSNDGDHRWAGEHRGKAAIERFLRDFTAAGLQGELRGLQVGGPPWDMTVWARFDDEAVAPDGEVLYRNRVAMVIRARWGKIVRHEDFYEDSGRIETLEQRLSERGVVPAPA